MKVNLEVAGTYSILIDECKDNAGHEELALCFRYVNQDGYIEERFYEMVRLKDTDAESIFQIGVLNTLENIGLTSSLIALGADGASVMSGCNEGVYSKLKRSFPWLIYIHCTAHRLNLIVLTYLKSISVAKGLFDVYQSLHNVFNVAKNREIFEETQKEVYPNEHMVSAKSLTDTRWSCRFLALDTIYRKLKALLISLQKVSTTNSSYAEVAAGLYHKILSSKFIISLVFLHEVLGKIQTLILCMQEKNIKWISIVSEIHAIKQQLEMINISEIIGKASIKCSEIGITINYEDPLQSLRSNSLYDPKLFCQEQKEKSINNITKEFDRRFSKGNIQLLSSLDSLDASKQAYLDFDAITYIAEHFKNCITFDFMLLKNESERAKIVPKDGHPLDLDFYPQFKRV